MAGMSVLSDPALQGRIDALQAQSAAQEAETLRYFGERAQKGDLNWDGLDADANRFMADKLVALEPIKAEFCHMLCRALGARRRTRYRSRPLASRAERGTAWRRTRP